MELKVRTKKAITSPEQVAKIFETIQKTENEIEFDRRELEGLERQEAESIREVREGLGSWRAAHREQRAIREARKVLEADRLENGEILEALES